MSVLHSMSPKVLFAGLVKVDEVGQAPGWRAGIWQHQQEHLARYPTHQSHDGLTVFLDEQPREEFWMVEVWENVVKRLSCEHLLERLAVGLRVVVADRHASVICFSCHPMNGMNVSPTTFARTCIAK